MALLLARQECKLAIADIDEKGSEGTKFLIRKENPQALVNTYKTDVSDYDQCEKVVQRVEQDLGEIDILLLNAGLMQDLEFSKMSVERINKIVTVNLLAYMWFINLVLKKMVARRSGHIACVSSIASQIPLTGMSVYSATKFAVTALLDAVRAETANTNVKITSIQPYFIKTNDEVRAAISQ